MEKEIKNDFSILLVEDNYADIFLLKESFNDDNFAPRLTILKDGQSAIEYFSNNPEQPDLVILDINLPRLNGFQVLDHIKTKSGIRDLPVVMLSSSSDNTDIERSISLGAKQYFVKPDSYFDYSNITKSIRNILAA
jgi:CheY-like chemotaxis protein